LGAGGIVRLTYTPGNEKISAMKSKCPDSQYVIPNLRDLDQNRFTPFVRIFIFLAPGFYPRGRAGAYCVGIAADAKDREQHRRP
jgi:hypothetical protein